MRLIEILILIVLALLLTGYLGVRCDKTPGETDYCYVVYGQKEKK